MHYVVMLFRCPRRRGLSVAAISCCSGEVLARLLGTLRHGPTGAHGAGAGVDRRSRRAGVRAQSMMCPSARRARPGGRGWSGGGLGLRRAAGPAKPARGCASVEREARSIELGKIVPMQGASWDRGLAGLRSGQSAHAAVGKWGGRASWRELRPARPARPAVCSPSTPTVAHHTRPAPIRIRLPGSERGRDWIAHTCLAGSQIQAPPCPLRRGRRSRRAPLRHSCMRPPHAHLTGTARGQSQESRSTTEGTRPKVVREDVTDHLIPSARVLVVLLPQAFPPPGPRSTNSLEEPSRKDVSACASCAPALQ